MELFKRKVNIVVIPETKNLCGSQKLGKYLTNEIFISERSRLKGQKQI